jgi:hypothetical protein
MAAYSALQERRGGMKYVVDQNMMRSDELRALVSAEPASQFVIPDAAWEEMLKHERWEYTVRRSFDVLSSALDRTFVSVGVGGGQHTGKGAQPGKDQGVVTRSSPAGR